MIAIISQTMMMTPEMQERGVDMFDGLRTTEGQAIAQAFLAAFAAEKLVTENDDPFEFFAALGDFQPRPRSYTERVESARMSSTTQRALAEQIKPHCDGGPITPAKALLIADIMQMHSILPGAQQAIYALMPEGFKNDDVCQEDFGSVSQRANFDPLREYQADPMRTPGVYEYLVNDTNVRDSLRDIAALDEGRPSQSTPVTGRELAERFLAEPLRLVQQLVSLTKFVRESNEASWGTLVKHYAPALHAQEQAKEDVRKVHAGIRMAVDAIAKAAGVQP